MPSGLQPPRIHFPKANKQCSPLVLVGGYYSGGPKNYSNDAETLWNEEEVGNTLVGSSNLTININASPGDSGVHKSCWFSSGNTEHGIVAVVIVRLIKLCRCLQWSHRLLLTRFFYFTFLRIKGEMKPISVRLP